jgi:hypothetical protein
VPRDFALGFDAQTLDTERGEFGSYLLGEWSRTGWWYYNALCFLMKEHLAIILLLLLSPLALRAFRTDTLAFLGPLLVIGIPLSLLSSLQLGIRYLLPIYPFLFLMAAASARLIAEKLGPPRSRIAFVVLALSLGFTAVNESPSHLAYFNPVALRFGEKSDLLLDSNLDWGQDLYQLEGINQTLAGGEPIGLLYFGHVAPARYGIDFQLIPAEPVRGVLAVSTAFLKGYPYIAPAPEGGFVEIPAGAMSWLASVEPLREEGSITIFDTRALP